MKGKVATLQTRKKCVKSSQVKSSQVKSIIVVIYIKVEYGYKLDNKRPYIGVR
jgi:hypothetical protein